MRAALETKDLLLARLQKMNDEIEAGMHKQEGGQRPAAFQKAYAQVLVDLQMVKPLNKIASCALLTLCKLAHQLPRRSNLVLPMQCRIQLFQSGCLVLPTCSLGGLQICSWQIQSA